MTMRGRPKKATLSDVAQAAEVSAATVSRVLRNPEVVSAEFQSRVRHAVDKLGYVPDPAARSLASARSENIGVVIPSVTNNVFVEVLSGIYTVIQETNFNVEIGNTRYSPMQEEKILRMLLSRAAGWTDRHWPLFNRRGAAPYWKTLTVQSSRSWSSESHRSRC